MNHSFIDEHSNIDSPLSRLDPRVKVIGFLLLVTCIALAGRDFFRAYLFYSIIVVLLALVSRIPPGHILKRSAVIAPFLIVMAAFVPFMPGGDPVLSFGFAPLEFTVSRTGLQLFSSLAIKSFLSLTALIVLTASTPFVRLLKALQDLRVPLIIIMVLSFMYRYIFIIEDEFMKMKQARDSRMTRQTGLLHFRSLANLVGVLFIRAYERSESVYMAMCSRGFRGEIIVQQEHLRLQYQDLAFLALMVLSLSGIQWFCFYGQPGG